MKSHLYLIVLLVSFIITSCDPQFDYSISGKIVDNKENGIEKLRLEYKFYPINNFKHWRTHLKDSIIWTNENGRFEIKVSTLTMNFDSIKIKVNNANYKETYFTSKRDDWNTDYALNYKEFKYDFGNIKIIKNYC